MQYELGVQCRTPSRSDRFNGVTGGAGGPKGRNRNLPWPPAKKVIRKLLSLLFISTPQSRLTPCQLLVEGSLLVRFTTPCTISAGRQCVKCSKIVYRLCNHMVYSFDILKASQKKRKRWRWLAGKDCGNNARRICKACTEHGEE